MSKIKVVDFNNNKEQQEAISTLDDPLYKEAKVNLMAAQSGNVSKHNQVIYMNMQMTLLLLG